jgi:peptidyl-prolyl cis-trans isomerase B (cyclophilin B)
VAGKKERQRRLARERYHRRAVRQEQRYRQTQRWTAIASVCLLVIALAAGGFFLFRGHGQHADPAATTPAAGAAPTPTPAATPTPSPTPTPTKAEPAKHCTYTANPPASRDVGIPPARPDYKAKYQATIHTNRGDIVINMRNSVATCTVNSFVFLAAKKYFSNTHCHRLTTTGIFVLQCGDPTGTGSGGPGYKFDDENLTGAKYPAATVAMANSGPNTNGSQFFLVYKDSAQLQPKYTPFGTIVSGLNIIQNVAKAGSDNANGPGDGHPKEKVVIKSVTIKKT